MGSRAQAAPCRLDEGQLAALETALDARPLAAGWQGQWWTLARVRDLVARKFGIHYTWTKYRDLLIAAHRQLPGGIIVLVRDNLNVHTRAELRAFTGAQKWLRVFQRPAYAPELNPRRVSGPRLSSPAVPARLVSRPQRSWRP
jgi:hypothetical protein